MANSIFTQNVLTNKTVEQKKISSLAKRTHSQTRAKYKPGPVTIYTPKQVATK